MDNIITVAVIVVVCLLVISFGILFGINLYVKKCEEEKNKNPKILNDFDNDDDSDEDDESEYVVVRVKKK